MDRDKNPVFRIFTGSIKKYNNKKTLLRVAQARLTCLFSHSSAEVAEWSKVPGSGPGRVDVRGFDSRLPHHKNGQGNLPEADSLFLFYF